MRRFALALSIVLLWACPSISAAEERHSGAVVSIDRAAGTLVMTELTASRSEAPVMVKRTIKLTPDSQIMLLQRSQEDATTSGWPGGFVASPVTADDLRPGDFITVMGRGSSGRMEASALELVHAESSSASPR